MSIPVKVLLVIKFSISYCYDLYWWEILHQYPVVKQQARNENRHDWKQCKYHLSIRNRHSWEISTETPRFCKNEEEHQVEGFSLYRIGFVVLKVQDAVVSKLDIVKTRV